MKGSTAWQAAGMALACTLVTVPRVASAATPTIACTLAVGPTRTVVTAAERAAAAKTAKPPLTDIFAWPDGPFGVLRAGNGLAFFATDGGTHRANGKAGSVTLTMGDLEHPLGSASAPSAPLDLVIQPGAHNPHYAAYDYIGGGPVYEVPAGMPGAGQLLTVYHAERATTGQVGFYSLLGLAKSRDGRRWTDLGEIVQANQPYRSNLDGYDIGLSQLVTDPTGTYFYVYFPDWIANGTVNPSGTTTTMSVARVPVADLLRAAFAAPAAALPPFAKFYRGAWKQPGRNGLSTDLEPGSAGGAPSVSYDAFLKRYVVIGDDTVHISYAESADGLVWTSRVVLKTFASALYARAIGTGPDPNVLGPRFFVYFTHRPNWTDATVRRFPIDCT